MKKFFSGTWLGIRVYKDALRFISENNLWVYFILPVLLFALVYWGSFVFESVSLTVKMENAETIRELMRLIALQAFYYSLSLMLFKLNKYIVFIFLSPMLNRLSLRTEEIITGNTYAFSWAQFWMDIRRAIRIAIGNFLIEYSIFAIWFIFIMFYSPADYFTKAFMFFVGCYFYGFSLIDYINERRRLTIDKSVEYVRENAGFSFGLGLVFSAMFFIPLSIGVIFAPVVGIVAATIGMHLLVDLNTNEYAIKKVDDNEDDHLDNS